MTNRLNNLFGSGSPGQASLNYLDLVTVCIRISEALVKLKWSSDFSDSLLTFSHSRL